MKKIATNLSVGEKKRLQIAIGERVYAIKTSSLKQSELFRSLYSSIKQQFNVDSYKNLKKDDLQKAIKFIENWKPLGRV